MKKQVSGSVQELPQPDELQLKINNSQQPISEYINFLRNQIKHLGTTIDSEFDKASEFIFSLYKHYYSPQQCPGQKATLLNKLSSCGVQWALQSNLEQRMEEFEGHSDQGRSANLIQERELSNPNKAYNIRAKTKPQKYKYSNIEDEYSYGDKTTPKHEGPKRGRPAIKKQSEVESKRDITNPYEKAPYKKRRVSHVDQDHKDESIGREDINKSSAKWDSEDEKDQVNVSAKVEHDEKEPEKEGHHHVSSEKGIKHADEGKKVKNAEEGKKVAKEAFAQTDGFSHLVEEYKKNWSTFIFELSLQSDNA